mmetsp:Transcript_37899/g.80530  ORF Transcript_37899/g.80530 Transcript_37899/m.80530 type:complete len:560 (-) Transcript_37899:51-1730(-)
MTSSELVPPPGAVTALSDEVLLALCECLPGRDLLRFSATATPLNRLTSDSSAIWRFLSAALLGDPSCYLHAASAERAGVAVDTRFWKSLFRHGLGLQLAHWSPNLRTEFLQSLPGENQEENNEHAQQATVGSGHCAVGIGHLVIKVGGLRPNCTLDHLHSVVFDLKGLAIREVSLSPDSAKPERRLRHAACEIRPELTSRQPAVLVLGGCHDRTKKPCQGGLHLLHVLELLNADGTVGKWHSIPATGQAPGSIWHHICGSFAFGRKVVVFGGDFNGTDPEFRSISNRILPAGFVYVLDVDSRLWDKVMTTGLGPTWRSLHAGFTHRDVSSHSERLVILGGCAETLPIFSSSDELAPMDGHALDLRNFEWLPQPSESSNLPPSRLRLASEKVGEWLVLYGGHGEHQGIGERVHLHKLNLRTLRWSTFDVQGREGSCPAAPAATLTAGLVLGGVKFGRFGITPVPKLDVLLLGNADAQDNDESMEPEEQAQNDDDHSDDDDDLIEVLVRDGSGNARRMVLPIALLARLRTQQAHNEDNESSEDNENAETPENEDDNGVIDD